MILWLYKNSDPLEIYEASRGIERRKLRWYGHLVRMAEDRKPRQILEARREGKRGRGRPRKVWMDDITETAGRRGKTIQKVRSMAMTGRNFRR